jgi:hypothetical protein
LVALVDNEDFELASKYSWSKSYNKRSRTAYAVAYVKGSKPYRMVRLHRLIMGAPPGVQVDHVDLNGLNCQRGNLRVATNGQNGQNRPKYLSCNGAPTTSQFKGVHWFKRDGCWAASGTFGGKSVHLGYFNDEAEAARAYNSYAASHYGEFARPNIMGE